MRRAVRRSVGFIPKDSIGVGGATRERGEKKKATEDPMGTVSETVTSLVMMRRPSITPAYGKGVEERRAVFGSPTSATMGNDCPA